MASMKWDSRMEEWVAINPVSKPQPVVQSIVKSDNVRLQILQNPRYSFVLKFTEYLYESHGFDLVNPVFRNRIGSYQSKGQIVFGYDSVNRAFDKGFLEYATVNYVWSRQGYRTQSIGYVGLWMLVLHEFAHVIQGKEGTRGYGSVHNQSFCNILRDLIILFPFSEMEKKF
jgi:hypothetical protein